MNIHGAPPDKTMALDQVDVDTLEEKKKGGKEMSFFDHLEELRWHIIRSLAAILVFAVGLFFLKDIVFNTVIFGPRNPNFITYRAVCGFSNFIGLGDNLCFYPKGFELITPDMGELFITHMKVSALLGFVLAFPYIFWEIWRFVKPGLYDKEQRVTKYAVAICSSLFVTGVLFGYFIISPFAVSFLTGYQLPGVEATPALESYISYLVMFTLPTGLVFEMPVAAYVLTKIGLISSNFLREYRRHSIVAIFIIAGVITPPDAFSQILVAVPLLGLYQISIIVAKKVEKQQALEEKMGA